LGSAAGTAAGPFSFLSESRSAYRTLGTLLAPELQAITPDAPLPMNSITLMLVAPLACSTLLAAAVSAAVPQNDPGPTVRWEVDDNFGRWIGTDVALGDNGAVIIASHEWNTPGIAVHTTADEQTILDFPLPDTWQIRVDAARAAETLAAIAVQYESQSTGSSLWAELKVWKTARDGHPDWVYRFPPTGNYLVDGMDVLITDDGQRIVAFFTDVDNRLVELRVFDVNGQVLLDHQVTRPFNSVNADAAELSADGRWLLLDVSSRPALIDLDSGIEVRSWDHHSLYGGMAISGDGNRVAIGADEYAEVWERNPQGRFTRLKRWDFGRDRTAGEMALDHDGSHLAMTVMDNTEWFQVRVKDLNQDLEVYRHEFAAPGNGVKLWPSEIEMTEDAQIVVGASWGDSFDLTPTGFAFDGLGQLTAEIRTPGSALACDMDPTGQVMAFSTKRAHVNEFGAGGQVICADTRPVELRVAGYPQAGAKIEFSLTGAATEARVAVAHQLGAGATPWGVSQLDLTSVLYETGPLPMTASSLQRRLTLPDHSGLIGTALHFQGVLLDSTGAASGGVLTNRVSVRVLP